MLYGQTIKSLARRFSQFKSVIQEISTMTQITLSIIVAASILSIVQAASVNSSDEKILREIQLSLPFNYVGQDSNGRAVYIAESGRWNYRPFMNGGPAAAKFSEFLAGFYSELQESENGSILINDMKGFDASPLLNGGPGQKFLQDQLVLYDKIVRGGDGLKSVYVVNANKDWMGVFSYLKANFPELAKLYKNFGSNVTEWYPELLQFLNLDVTRMSSSVTVSPLQAILEDELPAKIRDKFPYYLSGYSPEGSPVFIADPGRWDYKFVIDEGPRAIELYSKRLTQLFLRVCTYGLQVPGSPGSLFIPDFRGLSDDQVNYRNVRQVLLLPQYKNFDRICAGPGLRRTYFLYNTDTFTKLFSEAKPFMKNTVDRSELYGENVADWTSVLRNVLRPPLPEEYGGVKGYSPLVTY